MRRWFFWLSILLLCKSMLVGWPAPAQAQVAVFDAANLVQTTVTAIQSVLSVANQVLELTQLGQVVLATGAYAADLEQLATIVREARGLSYDLQSLNAQITLLFSLDTAPASATELHQRLTAIRQMVFESYVYALRTQTLLTTTLRTVQHLTRLVASIEALIGNLQSNQTLAQLDGTLTQSLATLQVQTNAYQRAQSVERMAEPLTLESINRINESLLQDHPR